MSISSDLHVLYARNEVLCNRWCKIVTEARRLGSGSRFEELRLELYAVDSENRETVRQIDLLEGLEKLAFS